MSKELKSISTDISKIWEITDGCGRHYICTMDLYFLSMWDHSYDIIIYCDILASGCGKYVVLGLRTIGNNYIYTLISTNKLHQISVNTSK